jgi:dCTP deaminase
MLSNVELQKELEAIDPDRRLVVMPLLDRGQIGSASIDLRLGTEFIEVERLANEMIDPFAEDVPKVGTDRSTVIGLGESLILHPGQFVLGCSLEFIRLPSHLAGQVLGRSSWGRLGLVVATAVTVQPGFAGVLTLELENLGTVPIKLYPGLRIAQLSVWRLGEPTSKPYFKKDAKYTAPIGPQSSRLGWEASEVARLRRVGARLAGQ